MPLNFVICCDLVQDILVLSCKDVTLISRFMLAGKEMLLISKNAIDNIDRVKICGMNWLRSSIPPLSYLSNEIVLHLVSSFTIMIYIISEIGRLQGDQSRTERSLYRTNQPMGLVYCEYSRSFHRFSTTCRCY